MTLSPRQLSHHSPGPAVWPGYNWNIPTKKTFVLSLRLNDLSWWICDPSLGPVSHFNVAHDPGKWRHLEKCRGLDESRDLRGE